MVLEIHVKSSDRNKHNHNANSFYDMVILHVIYEYDKEIKFLNSLSVYTLELKSYITGNLLNSYSQLTKNKFSFIPCEKLCNPSIFSELFSISEKLYLDKLQIKCNQIFNLYETKKHSWEASLSSTLAYTLGLKINAEAFEQILDLLDYKVIQKISQKKFLLESLFFGITHNLSEYKDEYPKLLDREFNFIKTKFNITEQKITLKYFRLRPANFPTIRLSQLANIIFQYQSLFSYVIGAKNIKQYYMLLDEVQASSYWNDHYIFDKESKSNTIKKLSSSQKDLIIMNCFLPVKFAYSKSIGKSMEDEIIFMLSELKAEKNSIIEEFQKMGACFKSALDTQAFLYLYKNKCSQKNV